MHGSARAPGTGNDSKIPTENDGSACSCASTGTNLPVHTPLGFCGVPPLLCAAAGPGPGSASSFCQLELTTFLQCWVSLLFFIIIISYFLVPRCGKIVTLDTGVCVSCWQALSELASPACVTLQTCRGLLEAVCCASRAGWVADGHAGRGTTHGRAPACTQVLTSIRGLQVGGVFGHIEKEQISLERGKPICGLKADGECTGEEEMIARGLQKWARKDFRERALKQ